MKKSFKSLFIMLLLPMIFFVVGCTKDEPNQDEKDEPLVQDILPTNIQINNKKETVTIGDSFTLSCVITPTNCTKKEVTWSSSDEKVAKIDTIGNVTAVGLGKCIITINSVASSTIKDSFELTVVDKKMEVTSITISGLKVVEENKSITLTASVFPNGANSEVVWSSSDEKIFTIDDNGVLKGIKEGTAKAIAVSKENSVIFSEYEVIVKKVEEAPKVIFPTSIEIDGLDSVTAGYKTQYNVKAIYPEGAEPGVNWYSRNEAVATIDNKGVLTGVKAGVTYIYAVSTADTNVKSAYLKVNVTEPIGDIVYPDLQGYVIEIMDAASEMQTTNPFSDLYIGSDKVARQKAWTDAERNYNCKIKLVPYPDEYPWGNLRRDWINNMAAAGTPQADIYMVAPQWLTTLVNGKSIRDLSSDFGKYGNGQIETYQRQMGTYKKGLYVVTTGINETKTNVIYGLFYNYGMLKKYNIVSPAQLFNEGKWSQTDFVNWCLSAQAVLPENNWVLAGIASWIWSGMTNAAGVKICDTTSLKLNYKNEYSLSAIETLQKVYQGGAYDTTSLGQMDAGVISFQDGKAIMQAGKYRFVRLANRFSDNLWGEGSTEYGYVPFPWPDNMSKEKTFINGVLDNFHVMAEGRTYPMGVIATDVYRAVQDMFVGATVYMKNDPSFDSDAAKRQMIESKLDDPASIEAAIYFTSERVLFDPVFNGFISDNGGTTVTALNKIIKEKVDIVQTFDSIYDTMYNDFVAMYA